MNLKLLVVEGNLIEENQNFKKAGIETHTESLSDSLNFFNKNIDLDVVNPSSDKDIMNKVKFNREQSNQRDQINVSKS